MGSNHSDINPGSGLKPANDPSSQVSSGNARFKKLMDHSLNDGRFYLDILLIMSGEIDNLETELRTLLSERDIRGIRSYHHKISTTLKLLELDKLNQSLSALKHALAEGSNACIDSVDYRQAVLESHQAGPA